MTAYCLCLRIIIFSLQLLSPSPDFINEITVYDAANIQIIFLICADVNCDDFVINNNRAATLSCKCVDFVANFKLGCIYAYDSVVLNEAVLS